MAKQLQKNFDLWSTQKYSKVSKICSACSEIFLEFRTCSSQQCTVISAECAIVQRIFDNFYELSGEREF